MERQELIERISCLPPESLAKVEDLLNSLTAESATATEQVNLDTDISAYAARYAGTEFDLDPELEAAGIEHLLETVKW